MAACDAVGELPHHGSDVVHDLNCWRAHFAESRMLLAVCGPHTTEAEQPKHTARLTCECFAHVFVWMRVRVCDNHDVVEVEPPPKDSTPCSF